MGEMEVPQSWLGKVGAMLLAVWAAMPDSQKERAFNSVIKGFEAVFGHFWDLFQKRPEARGEAPESVEAAP